MSSIRNALLSNRTERILSRGLIGPRGEPAPTITGWRIDLEGYAVMPVLSNGTGGAPLELRSLFEQSLKRGGVASPARAASLVRIEQQLSQGDENNDADNRRKE